MARSITPSPADVPQKHVKDYCANYAAITKNSNNLFIFAADQKIEHLNQDFYGPNISKDAQQPEHLFQIASTGIIGAFATQLGLIARYGGQYPHINYIAKLNSKTNIIPTEAKDPYSPQLWSIDDVDKLIKNSGLLIRGVGYTIYLGSEYEELMLKEAARIIFDAHQKGLIAILWIYPRGKHISNDIDPQLISGAAGIAAALGSDFVKIKPPHTPDDLQIATHAAGNTGIVCSGGASKEVSILLSEVYQQMATGKARGCAIGRNIFQKSLSESIALTHALSSIVYHNSTPEEALLRYNEYRTKQEE